MHLKSITLQGFKTFAARTTLDLRPGITAIVGPNGTGKSNIADAVRWALGESNLRHVRCRTTDELIFAGNAKRSAVGMADVSLIFENDGGWLDVPFNEVRVSRRAYRSGENEYLLNGSRVRLRDIVDLLAGASINAGGHVVVGQGLVDAVLAQRPEERRPLIESLAGLKQYYLRRDEAEARLSSTEANLVHVDTMVAEISPQLANLTAQAGVLRAHRAAAAELRELQSATFGAQAARLVAHVATTQAAAAIALTELTTARAEAGRLRDEDNALVTKLADRRATRDETRNRIAEQQRLVANARRDRDVASAQAVAAEERARFTHEEHTRLAGAAVAERERLDDARAAANDARAAVTSATAALEVRRQEAHRLQVSRESAQARLRQAQAAQADVERTVARLAEAVATSIAKFDSLARDLERHVASASSAALALQEAEDGHTRAVEALATAQVTHATLSEAERDSRAALDTARRVFNSAQSAHQDAVRRLESAGDRHDVLEAWLRNLDGNGDGARRFKDSEHALGVVGQALYIDPAWQASLATLLGSLYEAVLTSDPTALVHLTAPAFEAGGRIRIVVAQAATGDRGRDRAVDRQQAPSRSPLAPAEALTLLRERGALTDLDAVGWATGVARDLNGIAVCQAVKLDRVLLVRSVDAVLRCRPHLPEVGLCVVTDQSPVAALDDGSLVWGIDSRTVEILTRRHELAALEQAMREALDAEVSARARKSTAVDGLRALEHEYERTHKALSLAEAGVSRARDEARFNERLVLQARRTAEAAGPMAARLEADLRARQARHALDETALATARDAADRARMECEESQAALSRADERLATAVADRRDEEAALALMQDRLTAANRLVEELQRRSGALDADLARHAAQLGKLEVAIAELTLANESATARDAVATTELESLETALRPLELQLQADEEHYMAIRSAARQAGERLTAAESAQERARREADSYARDLEVLRAQVAAELGCGIEALPDGPAPHGAVTRVKALRAELAAMGPVNARAEDDLATSVERLDFLRAQSGDLREGVSRLRGIISDANATVRERFAHTVAQLDQQFSLFFVRLFGGGSCKLLAEYDQSGAPTGVDIQAQPPGKRTRELALLSGGERALIAMALLFAMLRVRPVPFCLLDEVEAALDEANTGRFGAILRELSTDTQFLLVTHNRGTMLHADRLYGITMSETGISTAASLELSRNGIDHDVVAPSGAVP